jgi:prepilin-type N-terminal cleavage/methylation domain-containing protein
MNIYNHTRGDTIIEVLLASVILSIVLAGAYSLSSRATRINQAAYERTRASNLVQEQAELLRAAKSSTDISYWTEVISNTNHQPEPYYDCRAETSDVFPDIAVYDGIFYLEDSLTATSGYKVSDNLYNTWVAKSLISDGSDGYVDFYIYTCWEGLGTIGDQVTGAVLRLGVN